MKRNNPTRFDDTPLLNKLMRELGWKRLIDEVPLFCRETKDDVWKFFISFPVDYWGNFAIYEDFYDEGKTTEEQTKELIRYIDKMTANTFVKKISDELIAMLTADFYWHQRKLDKHKEWAVKYEQLSGNKYK